MMLDGKSIFNYTEKLKKVAYLQSKIRVKKAHKKLKIMFNINSKLNITNYVQIKYR